MTYDPYERSAADGKDANEAEARGEPITAVALTCRCVGSRPAAFCGHTHETVADALACPVRRADRGFATWVTVRAPAPTHPLRAAAPGGIIPDRMVCANAADADDLRQAADMIATRHPSLADRLRNLAFDV